MIVAVAALAVPAALAQRGTGAPPPTPPTVTPPATTPVRPPRPVGPRPIGSPAPPEALIVGQVVDQTGKGVFKAAVRLIGDAVIETVLTDERGRFFFRSLPPSDAIVTAQKFGFFDGAHGQRRASGQPLPFTIGFGRPITDMKIELYRGAVITGSVADDGGEPVAGIKVEALRRQFADGVWHYAPAGTDLTDDLGRYRVHGLRPGEYIVTTPSTMYSVPLAELEAIGAQGTSSGAIGAVLMNMPGASGLEKAQRAETHARVSRDGATLVWSPSVGLPDRDDEPGMFATQFYPMTDRRLLALPMQIAPGEVRYAVDFQLAWVAAYAVRGRLVGTAGTTATQIVRLLPADADADASDEVAMTVSAADGRFVFPRVPQGRYRASVEARLEPGGRFWAHADVSVTDEDVVLPELWLRPATGLTADLALEQGEGAPRSGPTRLTITITPAGPGLSAPRTISMDQSGRFIVPGLVPGEYSIGVGALPPGWFLKSVTVDGRSALDGPVDISETTAAALITLTTRATQIIGTVRDARMLATSGAAVIIMPALARGDATWMPNRTRDTRASTNGVFIVSGLPPGDYLVVAIDDAAAEGWQDPAVTARLQRLATRITLGDAEQKTMQIRISQVTR